MNNKCCNSTNNYYNTYQKILDRMINRMTSAPLGNSISANFISQMIPHHKAAIEMSENILKYTDNCTLKSIAENIISEQTQSIADMEKIFCGCKNCVNNSCDLQRHRNAMNDIMQTMFREMRSAKTTDNVNCDFLREMIPHHEGAVRMCEATLGCRICADLRPILDSIIASQKKGIAQMKKLERTLGCGCCK